MALIAVPFPESFRKKLLRHIRAFVAKGIIPHLHDQNAEIQPAFWMYTHLVPRKEIRSLAFGKPEGLRVILFENGDPFSAIDFFFQGSRLKFSACVVGPNLQLLMGALNRLEKVFRHVKRNQEVQYVHFLFNPYPYLMLKDGRQRTYFHFPNGKMKEIRKEKLSQQVSKILNSTTSHAK